MSILDQLLKSQQSAQQAGQMMQAGGQMSPAGMVSADPMAQPMTQPQGGIWGALGGYFSNPDNMDRLAMGFNTMRLTPDSTLQAALGSRINQRDRRREIVAERERLEQQQQERGNRTAAYFRENGMDGMAKLIEGDPRLAGPLLGAVLEQRISTDQARNTKAVGDVLVDADTGAVIFDGRQSRGEGYSPEQLKLINELRDDLKSDPNVKAFRDIEGAYDNISVFFNNPGAVSDKSLAVAYAKILDPTSVAREGEVSMIANSGAIPASLKSQLINAIQGKGELAPEVRLEIAQRSTDLYNEKATRANATLGRYREFAGKAGADWSGIYMGDEISPADMPQLPSGPPTINSQEAYDALPSGAEYIEDGKRYRKP